MRTLLVILAAVAGLGVCGCCPDWRDGWGRDYFGKPAPREVEKPKPTPADDPGDAP